MSYRLNIPQKARKNDNTFVYKIFQIRKLPQKLHDIDRAREIFAVVLRHDIAYFFDFLNDARLVQGVVHRARKLVGRERRTREYLRFPLEKRIRLAFEELGPTFVKLGQILSTRGDILPQVFVSEFQKLQDNVPPFSGKDAIKIVEDEFEKPIGELYTYFDEEPIAAASIGQVHRAGIELEGKTVDVVVKVLRPGIEKVIQTDIDILFFIAQYLEKHIPDLQLFSPSKVVQEFSRTIQKEMNYLHEAYSMVKFKENFKLDSTIKIPDVYFKMSTERVLTMEFIDGIKISDFERLEERGIARDVIAQNGTEFILKQIFIHGFFHADPHPGNVFILPGNILVPIDFGIMGSVDDERITELMHLLLSIFSYDMHDMVKLFYRMGLIKDDIDVLSLKSDIKATVERYMYVPIEKLNLGVFFNELLDTIREYRIHLPTDLFLMIKSITSMGDTASRLDKSFDSFRAIKSFLQKQFSRRTTNPELISRATKHLVDDISYFLKRVPKNLDETLDKLNDGKLEGKMVVHGMDEELRTIGLRMRQTSVFIYVASLNIAGALCVCASVGPLVLGFPISIILGTLFLGIGNFIALLLLLL